MNYCLCLLAKINVRSFDLWFGFGKAFLFLSLLQQALLSVSFVLPKPCLSKAPSAERASLPCACVCRGRERRERERKREGETDSSISIAWKAPPHLPTWWAGSSILREAWWHAVKLGYCVLVLALLGSLGSLSIFLGRSDFLSIRTAGFLLCLKTGL